MGDLRVIGLPLRHLNIGLVDGRTIQAPDHAAVLLARVPVERVGAGRVFRVHRWLGRAGKLKHI